MGGSAPHPAPHPGTLGEPLPIPAYLSYGVGVGILYVAAAFGVVPGLLLLFHRLSRTPEPRPQRDDLPFAEPPGQSVADEAERWLQGQR